MPAFTKHFQIHDNKGTYHQRKHEWSNAPGHIRGDFILTGQEIESGGSQITQAGFAWCSQSRDLNPIQNIRWILKIESPLEGIL